MQEQTGIPYLLIDGRFANTAAALRLAGEILGVPGARRAARRLRRGHLRRGRRGARASVPPERRPRVYLARGPDGLETGLKGSINTEIIERVGGDQRR